MLNQEVVKGPWTKEEDDRVVELVAKYGPKRWSLIAKHLRGRIGKQCRERYVSAHVVSLADSDGFKTSIHLNVGVVKCESLRLIQYNFSIFWSSCTQAENNRGS